LAVSFNDKRSGRDIKSYMKWVDNTTYVTTDLQSLDFVINRFFMKHFTTKSIETVKHCEEYSDVSLPSVLWAQRVSKLEVNFDRFLSVL